jgi:hypothetical protein
MSPHSLYHLEDPAVTMPPDRCRWTRRGGLTKVETEDLLDWLDANGFPIGKLSLDENGFAVWYGSATRRLRQW